MTREHDDIDVAAWRADYEVIGNALQAAGWRAWNDHDHDLGMAGMWQLNVR